MQEENIANRLKSLIKELGINSSVFAERCGISRATLSQLLTGRNKKISDVIIAQVHKAYPNVSITWLLFNEGNMWVSGSEESTEKSLKNENLYVENLFENPEFLTNGKETEKYSKENGVNDDLNNPQVSNSKQFTPCLNTTDLLSEIENLRPKPRKIVHITIYFDDSTFETFYPK